MGNPLNNIKGLDSKRKADVILINSPIFDYSEKHNDKIFLTAPLGLGYLATIAKNLGFNTGLYDLEANKVSIKECCEVINKLKPKVVGINLISTNYNLSKEIINNLDPSITIIGGGPRSRISLEKTLTKIT